MKATEQNFLVVLFVVLYKSALTFESVDNISRCDHSSESYWAVLSYDSVCYAHISWIYLLSLSVTI